jgi:hypothetical protein
MTTDAPEKEIAPDLVATSIYRQIRERRTCVKGLSPLLWVTTKTKWVEAKNPSRIWALGAEGASSATGYLRSNRPRWPL